MPMIELKDVCKEYHSGDIVTTALTHIDLCVDKGEFVSIMGTSGSGKSTMLNIIGCMDKLTSGTYHLNGNDVSSISNRELSKTRGKDLAFVFQSFALMSGYTVFENAEIPLIAQGISGTKRKKMVMSALDAVGIADLAPKLTSHISGGQKQRTAIARAIVSGADMILADEPTGALDSKTGAEIMSIFSELHKQGKTILLITHDRAVADYAERLITLKDGRILSDEKN